VSIIWQQQGQWVTHFASKMETAWICEKSTMQPTFTWHHHPKTGPKLIMCSLSKQENGPSIADSESAVSHYSFSLGQAFFEHFGYPCQFSFQSGCSCWVLVFSLLTVQPNCCNASK
jgi:hypothetical protein